MILQPIPSNILFKSLVVNIHHCEVESTSEDEGDGPRRTSMTMTTPHS